ncbi:MAG: response regulator transcription factor [Candidatus Aminicenantes bacterium]|nr:response regulator transcription factor [Candidatus Aminicenantes bacterium]
MGGHWLLACVEGNVAGGDVQTRQFAYDGIHQGGEVERRHQAFADGQQYRVHLAITKLLLRCQVQRRFSQEDAATLPKVLCPLDEFAIAQDGARMTTMGRQHTLPDSRVAAGGGGQAGKLLQCGDEPPLRVSLQLLAEGKSSRQIASHLNISVKTVETRRQQIMAKLNTDNLADLIKHAIREGLTSIDPARS